MSTPGPDAAWASRHRSCQSRARLLDGGGGALPGRVPRAAALRPAQQALQDQVYRRRMGRTTMPTRAR